MLTHGFFPCLFKRKPRPSRNSFCQTILYWDKNEQLLKNHNKPTNGYLESVQITSKAVHCCCLSFTHMSKAAVTEKSQSCTYICYSLIGIKKTFSTEICGYWQCLSKYISTPILKVTFTINQSLTTEKTGKYSLHRDRSYSKQKSCETQKFCETCFKIQLPNLNHLQTSSFLIRNRTSSCIINVLKVVGSFWDFAMLEKTDCPEVHRCTNVTLLFHACKISQVRWQLGCWVINAKEELKTNSYSSRMFFQFLQDLCHFLYYCSIQMSQKY